MRPGGIGLMILFCVTAAYAQKERGTDGQLYDPKPELKSEKVAPILPQRRSWREIVASQSSVKAESQPPLPAEVSKLSPQAQAVWRAAEVKPKKIPPWLPGLSADEQARMLDNVIQLEENQREEDRNAPPAEFGAEQHEADDRGELVRPAPKNFKPEAQRKIKLTLIPRKTMLRKGESFWYRLELQNLGDEPLALQENNSFFKMGDAERNHYFFHIVPPNGKEVPVSFYFEMFRHGIRQDIPIRGGDRMTAEHRQAAAKRIGQEQAYRQKRLFHLRVTLQPGETLRTRSWRFISQFDRQEMANREENPYPPIPGEFRELKVGAGDPKFDEVGTYRIKATYLDMPPRAPNEDEITRMMERGVSRERQMKMHGKFVRKSFGRVESNSVAIEVVP